MKCAKKVAVWKSGIIEVDLYTASFIYVNLSPLPRLVRRRLRLFHAQHSAGLRGPIGRVEGVVTSSKAPMCCKML